MPYDERSFDPRRSARYAQRVAESAQRLPGTVLRANVKRERGLIFKKSIWEAETSSLDGWVLLIDPDQGLVFEEKRPLIGLYAWERGRILYLRKTGELAIGRYGVFYKEPTGHASEITDTRTATPSDVVGFDRLNCARYQKIRPMKDEAWREELKRDFQVRVPHAGMEASLALKRLLENQEYTKELKGYW